MNMQDKEMRFKVVPEEHLQKDVQKLRKLASVAGLLVNLTVTNGETFLLVTYSEDLTIFIRNRSAGRPRKKKIICLTCGEVVLLKEAEGAKVAASTLNIPIATFYRHYNDNKEKREEDPFV